MQCQWCGVPPLYKATGNSCEVSQLKPRADLQLYTHTQSMTQYSHVIGQFWVNPGLSLVEASVTDVTNMTHTRFRCLPCHPCPSSNHPGPGPGLTPLPPSPHLQTWILSHSRNWLPGWESVRNPHQSNLVEILLSYNSAIYTRQLLQHFQQHWNTLLNKWKFSSLWFLATAPPFAHCLNDCPNILKSSTIHWLMLAINFCNNHIGITVHGSWPSGILVLKFYCSTFSQELIIYPFSKLTRNKHC